MTKILLKIDTFIIAHGKINYFIINAFWGPSRIFLSIMKNFKHGLKQLLYGLWYPSSAIQSREGTDIWNVLMWSMEIYVPPEKSCMGWYLITPRKFTVNSFKGVGTRWFLMFFSFFSPKSCNNSVIIQLPRVLDISFMESLSLAVPHFVSCQTVTKLNSWTEK